MGKDKEKRSEKRLRYRWHAKFASDPKQKPKSGQMVDISSEGMSILCHADEGCPEPNQSITTNFGVPHFNSGDSFDTVFFNRVGRVCRVDKLSSKVNRVAVKFDEPLFFKPGEQNISDSDAKQRLQAKEQSVVGGKEKPAPSASSGQTQSEAQATDTKAPVNIDQENKSKSIPEETERAYSEALARAEERIRLYAEAKAQAEEQLKNEIEARHTRETELLAEADEKIRIYAEAKVRAEEKAKAEAKARAKAEAKAKTEARLRAKAEQKVWIAAEKRAKSKSDLQVKTEGEPETQKEDNANRTKQPGERNLMEKMDKFITDRNKIF